MPTLQELREKRLNAKKEILQIRDDVVKNQKEGKTGADLYGGEERQKRWTAVNDELNALDKQIAHEEEAAEVLKRGLELDREQRSATPFTKPNEEQQEHRSPLDEHEQRGESFGLALKAFCGFENSPDFAEREEVRAACKRHRIAPNGRSIDFHFSDTATFRSFQAPYASEHGTRAQQRNIERLAERRAMSAFIQADGGALVPASFVNSIEINMLAVGGVERVAEVLVTDRGEELQFPSADDTSNEGVIVGENETQTEASAPDLKLQRWGAYEFSSKILKVPNSLIEDSPANLTSLLSAMLGERLGRIGNRKFTTGTGASEPRGILTDAALGKTAAATTTITAEEMIDLFHSVDPSYRERPTCGFMCHDSILAVIRKLKTSNGDFIWRAGLEQGVPDRIQGRPYTYNQHMDSACAASNKTVLFGDLHAYKIRRVRGFRFIRLSERFADANQTGFLVMLRQDGKLFNAGTTPVKYLQQAAS